MEKKEIGLILSMLVMIVSCCEGVNDYDYLQVVIQWQPATCTDWKKPYPYCFQDPDNRFSIHGMWPSLYSGAQTHCFGSPFDVNQISILQPGISEIWPNVVTGKNQWLWGHEWDKHGTCTESILFDQEEYFSFTMDKYIENNLSFILGKSQITPNGQLYSRAQIYAAISAKTGKTPAVRCNYNYWSGVEQLHEITLCYNWNATAFEDCPLNANKCDNTFMWYPWSTTKALSV
ncbi:ribonuclease MC-like [Benincasa hispida]|uniref:ribonuclease MC-like n=1 Tax=Benincasa hispida TaxID=102211 RepID=UPI001900DEC4|nr:ribonuclease MC-like [Benincasa hispida]